MLLAYWALHLEAWYALYVDVSLQACACKTADHVGEPGRVIDGCTYMVYRANGYSTSSKPHLYVGMLELRQERLLYKCASCAKDPFLRRSRRR